MLEYHHILVTHSKYQRQNQKNLKFCTKNLKLGTLKSTRELHKPERIRMRIAANCILMFSAVFWSTPWSVTTVTVVHGTFAPAETRTQHIVEPLRVLAFAVALELLPGQVWAAEGLGR
jgi:pyruvate/2-oxoacid:ferredoxin oxidoreductase beta subunit